MGVTSPPTVTRPLRPASPSGPTSYSPPGSWRASLAPPYPRSPNTPGHTLTQNKFTLLWLLREVVLAHDLEDPFIFITLNNFPSYKVMLCVNRPFEVKTYPQIM